MCSCALISHGKEIDTDSAKPQLIRYFYLAPYPNRIASSLLMHSGRACLMVGKDEAVSNNHIFPPARGEDYNLGDILGRQGLATTVDLSAFGNLVTALVFAMDTYA